MSKLKKYLIGIAAVIAVVAIGSFPAFALGTSPVALVAAATTATPFATQVKLLAISGSVYALLQVVKQVFPLAGLGAILSNIGLSVFGVLVVIKPEDLFSLNTLTLVGIAAITAAGAHGTIKSLSSGGIPIPSIPTGTGNVKSVVALCLVPILVMAPLMATVGCTAQQLSTFDNAVNTLEEHLPQLAEMATGITALVAPEYAPLIAPAAGVIASDANLIKNLVDDYKTNPNATTLQKIDALWQDATSHLQSIVSAVGVKNPTTTATVNIFAGAAGEILAFVEDLVNKQPAATAQQLKIALPHFFGWNVNGIHAVAYSSGDNETDAVIAALTESASSPSAAIKKRPIHSTRQIAKAWNVMAKDHPHAKLKVTRARVLGVPIPFTGK